MLNILLPILICFAVGFTASHFQSDSILNWYPYLNKPSLIPPNYVFPIAWSILYVFMGVSIGLILNLKNKQNKKLLYLFAVQLILNFTWSISFFYLQNPLIGFINIILLDVTVLLYILKSYSIHKISSVLFIFYFLWLSFATYLNGYILIHN